MSDTYTHGHHESVLRSHRWRTAQNSAAYLLDHLRRGDQLLDVGCGPATITCDLARLVAPGTVTGLENVAEPLRIAQQTAEEFGLDNVEFERGDVYELPFADDVFDVVHAHQVLQHLTDPITALREMRRVCKPGGTVAVRDADYGAMRWYPDNPGLDTWLDLYFAVARGNGAYPDGGRRLRAWAREAGFAEVTATASAWCYATDDERAWWGGLWADRVRSSSFAAQAVDRGLASRERLDELAAAWRAWTEDPEGWFAVLNGEILCRA